MALALNVLIQFAPDGEMDEHWHGSLPSDGCDAKTQASMRRYEESLNSRYLEAYIPGRVICMSSIHSLYINSIYSIF